MGLPITSAGGNFAVGLIGSAVAIAAGEAVEDAGGGTLATFGVTAGIGVGAAMLTRGHFGPYMGGVAVALLGNMLLNKGD